MEKNYSVQELFFSWHNPKEKDESEVCVWCVHDEAVLLLSSGGQLDIPRLQPQKKNVSKRDVGHI